jgi:type II secretory pathway predicted ATPase ExeA
MYQTRFGLRRRPFPATPDVSAYYPATTHERALALVRRALDAGDGFAVLTGAPGTGKTLLCHCLLERLGAGVVSAFLTNSHLRDRTALLQAILYELSLPYAGTEQELRLGLTEFLLTGCRAGRRTVLVVDEAQHLVPDVLEELRLLGNLEAGESKAIQVVLAGQPALLETLRRPELAALAQRVCARAHLDPLPVEEAADYLLHHLRAAGARPERVFSEESVTLLARQCRGLPRLLNQAAHHALTLTDSADEGLVDVEAAIEALAQLGLADEETLEEGEFEGVGVNGSTSEPRDGPTCGDSGPCLLFDAPGRPA